jgi:hypothetical protein
MTTVTLTVGTGTQQWTPPVDCLSIDLIEIWGPGGSGGKRAARVTGGGSGAYLAIPGPLSVSRLLTAGTVPYQTGRGGAAQSTATTAGNPGTAKSWFLSSTVFAADLGLGGLASGTTTTAGGAGGLVANCIPTWAAKAGGNGGTDSSASGASSGGASGSAAGVGVNGAAISTAVAGGTTSAPAGGGNGGAASITASNATSGSSPGGGGGAINNASGSSGAGADGQINVTYTPNNALSEAFFPAQASSGFTFSNNNLTVTNNAGTWQTAFSTVAQTARKYYFEAVVTFTGSANCVVGIGNINCATTVGSDVGSSVNGIGWQDNGVVRQGGGTVATWATYLTGTRVCIAVDLDNGQIWGRAGIGANWNNSGTANPATNTGGFAIPAAVIGAAISPGVSLFPSSSNIVGAFAAASWVGIAPAGFGEWSPTAQGFRPTRRRLHLLVR